MRVLVHDIRADQYRLDRIERLRLDRALDISDKREHGRNPYRGNSSLRIPSGNTAVSADQKNIGLPLPIRLCRVR